MRAVTVNCKDILPERLQCAAMALLSVALAWDTSRVIMSELCTSQSGLDFEPVSDRAVGCAR